MNKKKQKLLIILFIGLSAIVILNKSDNNKDILIKEKINEERTIAMYKSEDGENYTAIESMPESGYIINEEKSYCTRDNKTHDEESKLKTIEGNHTISGLKKSSKCYVWFDKEPIASEKLIANSTKGSGTPDFSKTSCTSGCEESTVGTYTVEDPMYGGTSTYWRGDTTDNYVKFAGFCWRIVRINGDGSIRLIYDGTTCHANGTSTTESIAIKSVKYNSTYNQSNYVGWTYEGTSQRTLGGTSSNAKTQVESWYSSNIENNTNYASKIADGKFCNDRDVQSGSTWAINPDNTFYYAANWRLIVDYQPTLSCNSSDVYTLKVGLITADEVELAGGKNGNNSKYYLYNGQAYWTMTPHNWNSGSSGHPCMFYILASGRFGNSGVQGTYFGLRPVINLKPDVQFQDGGEGTVELPYIVSD